MKGLKKTSPSLLKTVTSTFWLYFKQGIPKQQKLYFTRQISREVGYPRKSPASAGFLFLYITKGLGHLAYVFLFALPCSIKTLLRDPYSSPTEVTFSHLLSRAKNKLAKALLWLHYFLCPGKDLNLHELPRLLLRQVRLPISPPGLIYFFTSYINTYSSFTRLISFCEIHQLASFAY